MGNTGLGSALCKKIGRFFSTTALSCAFVLALAATACISGNDAGPSNLPPPIPGGEATSNITIQIAANASGQGTAAYGQNPLTVDPKTKVIWTNNDSVQHTATSDSLIWDSGPLDPGESFSFTFTTPGSYPYHDTIYGKDSMSGTIEVRATVMPPTAGSAKPAQ